MIQDWTAQLPVLIVAAAVMFIPGVAALRLVGLRGLPLLASAPLFTVAGTAIIALLFGVLGVHWTAVTWAAGMVALIVLAAVIGWWAPRPSAPPRPSSERWLLPAGLAVGAILATWRIVAYIQDPSGISQTNDAVFHMNAVRYILQTQDASSLHVSAVIGGHGFYPAAWHGVASLVVLMTGTDIAIAVNVLTVVIASLIWTFGIAWLARAVTGSGAVAAYAAVLACSLQTFPLLMFQWGVLFPNALSTALIPAAIAAVITLPHSRDSSRSVAATVRSVLLVLVAVSAILLAQPAGILPWAAICAVWASSVILERRAMWGGLRAFGMIIMLWVALGAGWLVLSAGTSGSHWPPVRSKWGAALDVLLNGQVMIPFAFGISILMLIGIVLSVRSRGLRWFAVSWAGIAVLYVLVAAAGAPLIRSDLLGAWYADPYRIAALAPIVVIPLAALGLDGIVRFAAGRVSRNAGSAAVLTTGLAIATVLVTVLIIVRPVALPAVTQGTYDRESRYVAAADAYLNPDERALLESLPEHVPAGARVLGNPSTGAGFGYFLSGVDVYPRTWSQPRSALWQVLAADLRDAASDPAVCQALKAYGYPQYVVDFGLGEEGPGRYLMPGMTDFAGQSGFERVSGEGDATLWRITACAR